MSVKVIAIGEEACGCACCCGVACGELLQRVIAIGGIGQTIIGDGAWTVSIVIGKHQGLPRPCILRDIARPVSVRSTPPCQSRLEAIEVVSWVMIVVA